MMSIMPEDVFKVEKKFTYKNFKCIITLSEFGWRCAYVILPASHKYCNKELYNLYNLECHGGITFADKHNSSFDIEDGAWIIGFDYNHFGDNYDLEAVQKLFGDKTLKDARDLLRNETIAEGHRDGNNVTLAMVEEELKHLVDQL